MRRKHHHRYQGLFTRLASLARSLTTPASAGLLLALAALLVITPAQGNAQSATYRVTFQGTWTTTVTPGGVPSGAHFTTLIGAVHNDSVTFWSSGGTASAGVEAVAELGTTGAFKSEINANTNAVAVIEKSLPSGGTPTATVDFTVTTAHPLVTLLTMVAPSPDWFVGVSGLSLLDAQGDWLASHSVDLFPYDAGTEEGTGFSLNNAATSPRGTITSIQGTGKFSDEPIASLTFTLQSVAPEITSAATFTVDEGTTAVKTLTAEDQDSAAADLEWSKAGGADADDFTLSAAGELAFAAAPDYENPDDADGDRTYEVTVQVSDGDHTDTADIGVTLQNVIELFTELEGPSSTDYAENGAVRVAAYIASSEADRDGIAWSLGGDDAEHFSIDNPAGVLRFHIDPDDPSLFPQPPDFEAPVDDDGDRVYEVIVLARAGSALTLKSVTVTVTDENEAGAISLDTARPKAAAELMATLTDPDGVTAGTVTWQWERSAGRNTWVVIDGAEAASYTPVAADTNAFLRVTATYDEHGSGHSVQKMATNVVKGPLLMALRVTTDAATANLARAMNPAFEGETLHYAIGCNDSDTMQVTLRAPSGALVAIAGRVPSENSTGEMTTMVEVTPTSDVPISVTDRNGAHTVYHVHCLNAKFYQIEAGRYEDAEGVFEGLLLFRHAGHLVMMDSNGVPRFRETHADARSRTWFFRVGPDGVYRYAYATWISNRVNVLDQHMEVIDEQVSTVFPLRNMDPHDFVILPNGNYLLMSYELKVRDLSHLTFTDENERPYVTHPLTDSAIQIITRDNREALFTWDSWGKMPLGDCVQHRFAKKSESGYAHLNSLQMVGDHTIVGSFRGCSKVLGIDVATGSVKWRVGRTNLSDDEWASRDIGPAPIMVVNDPEGEFCGQHSATLLPNGHLLLFDNGAVCLINPWKRHRKVGTHGEYSRAVEYALDHDAGEAVFVRDHSLHGNKEAFGYSSGQVVPMDNGDWLISWGRNLRGQPLLEETVTQVDPATGQEKFFIRFTAANTEERASLTASPVPADALADTPGPLTAEIVESPASSLFHLGPADAPKVAVAFSRPVVNFAADTTSVSLTGATIAGISPHVVPGDPANAYLFTLTPTGVGPITFALVAGQPCASDGICTADETVLTKVRAPHVISPRTTGPAVASITSSATHPTKDGFTVTITFSEPVTGLTAGEIEVTNGTGSNFGGAEESYTLEIAPDAGIEDEVTVTVTAGAVVDGLNNGSLQASEAFPVDTKVPVVSTIEITSRPQTDATYAPGDAMEVTVTFSETVAVTGMPRLTLNVGGGNRTANYRSGADATLLFSYTVADGESDADGVSIEADSLSRNGGTIQDAADNDAVLDHEALAADSSHKVDGVKPELAVTGGAVVDGATLTLTYDEPLDGTSMPAASAFTVAGGSQSRTVSGVRVSGSTVELTVDPAVEQGETGIRVSYTVPTGMGASLIRDVPGNEALGLSSEAVTNETPDTIAPTVSTVEFSSDPGSDRIYAPEDEIQATVTLSEPVDVERTPRLMLKVGDRDRPAGYLEGTGTTELVFGYEVVDGDEDTDGVSIEANRLSLNADPVLWYAMPAASWNEALPVGNGRLAGMVFGNTGRERIQLNEDTLWAGAPYQRDILGAHRHLPEIRRLLFAGRYVEAQAMVNRELFIGGRVVRAYQTLGDLWIDLGTESQAGYRRELDLETGIARTEWTRDGVAFTREVFASAPHGVLVVRIEADTPGAITGTVELTRPVDATTTAAGTELVLEGRASHGGQQLGVRFQARLRAVPEGGSVVAEGASLRLSGADAVTLILAAATDYRGTAPGPDAVRQVEAAEATGYTALREAHVADHRAIFNRVWLELGGSEWRREPTDTRLRFVRSGGEDTDLEAMYFQFGRYLLMASSRPGTMPANLQGVWNEAVKPPWNSDYHININIQMIYWPADVANLSEMQEPLWDMLDRLRERGRATARDHYGFERGFVAHHTTDAWWWTSPVGSARYGMWPSGGAWLSRHMWEAYLFNRDAAFLRERAYPVLKEAAEFFLDWLVPEPGTDLLLSGPSISPENAFRINGRRTHVTMGPAMDQQIVRDLFENVLAAAAELGIDDAFTQETAAKLTKLAGPQVGTDGRLMEWRQEELVEADPGHRHISHAFGLYPGSQFTVRGTPDLAAAVRKSIEHRVANGGGGTGWSLGWLLNMWARLEAGGKAYSTLRRLLTDMTMDNLLDLHPLLAGTRTNVFQMDGNLGGTAGIAEMLLQSHAGEIHLLPALPRQWSRGVVEGLKARGGFEVSMAWSDGALTTVSIRSRSGEECRVRVAGGEVRTLAVGMGETRWFDGQLSEVRAPQGLGAPRDVAVTGSTPTSLSLSVTWQPPLFEGRSVYGYDVQYAKRGESGFREWPHRGRAPGTTITGLERDAAWKVRVRARNASGPGAWSSAVEYTGDIVAPPPPPVIDTIEITSNPGPDATYAAGDTIEVTVTFDETVAVTRMPQLTLNVGGVDQAANYGSGTGAALVFAYPVADSDLDTDGVSIEANRLSLNGGTIKDGSNNNAVLDHGGLAADSGHKVDAVKPQLAATGGAVVDGTRLTLTYDEALDGGSMPVSGDFTVSGGDRVRAVTGVRVNGSAVELTLDVAAEHGETGITVSYTPGTNPIRDAAGNEAEGLSRVPVTNETPDTTPPEVGSLAIGSNPGSDRTYAAEDDIEVTVTFSETVEVEGTPQLRLRVGTRTRTAGYLRGTDTAALVFGYEVADGDEDSDGVSIEAGRIALNGGTIKDEADNLAELAHGAVAAQARQKVDGVRPSFLSAAVDGASLTLTYGEALDGGSRPASGDFTVEVEGSGRSVSGVSVSGSLVTLTLNPAVDHGDTGTRVSYTVPTGVGTNPIQDEVGNDARGLSNQSVTNTTGAPNTEPEVTTPESFDVPENQLVARRLAARDTDPGDEVTGWSIVGGADQSEFSIASDTGELSFRDPPDFEAPGDNEYVVTVEVRSGAGARELEAEQTFTIRVTDEREPPEVPEAPVISGETADSLEVSWSEPDNTGPAITDYDVQYREKGTGRFIDGDQQGPGRTLTLEDLEPGTVYEVQVRAKNDEGTSDWSASGEGMTVTPLTVVMASGTDPPVSGPFTVRFSFSEPVTGFSASDIETGQDPACVDDQNNTVFCDPGIGTLQTADDRVFTTTVTPWTDRVAHSYTLRLAVPGGAVRSSVGSKPNEEPEEPLEVRVAPPGVTEPISSLGLTASGGNGSVRLSWNRPSDDGGSAIIRYEYRYAAAGEEFGAWENVAAPARSVTAGNLVNGREYVFEVRAVSALGKGGAETVMAVPELRIAPPRPPPAPRPPGNGDGGGLLFPPEAPAGLMALPGEGTVRLEWSPPESDGGTPILRHEYRLKEGLGEFGEWTPIADSAPEEVNATGYTVGELGNGTVYVFELRAVNLVGGGRVSEAVEAVMGLDPAYWSNFGAEDLQGIEASLERGPFGGGPQSLRLRFGAGLRFEESELDGKGEVTETRSGSYGYRYTSRTTGELRLDYDGGKTCELRLTFRGEGAGSYRYRCGGVLGGQGSFRMSGLNRGPEITSAGAYEVAENRAVVGQLEAVDQDKQDEITEYGIVGGADGGLFAVEAGELLFREAPDYETPGDVASDDPQSGAADNEYIVVVEVRSGEGERERKGSRAIRVRVADEEEPPEITGAGAFEVVENQTRVGQLEAVDQDKQDEITEYGIAGGADGGLFEVEAGELMFREAPDYETPGDVASDDPQSGAADNEYIVVVEVRSGEGERERRGSRAIRVRVTDEEEPPEITSVGPFEVAENRTRVGRLEAVDPDKQDEITGYGIAGGADGGLFAVEAETGELLFREAPDYENPGDVESSDPESGAGDNEYVVVVEVKSGEGERERRGSRAIRVRVSDEEEPPEAPAAPAVTAEGSGSLKVSWTEPENRGPEIVDYEVRYREGGEEGYSDGGHQGTGLMVRLSGLKEGTAYEVQVRAVNQEGMSEWSEPGEGRTDREEADPEDPDPDDPSDFTEGDLEGRRLTLRLEGEEGAAGSLELRFGEGSRFEQIESGEQQASTRSEGASRSGSYTYERTGPGMGTVRLDYDDGSSCEIRLSFTGTGVGGFAYDCGEGAPAEGSFRLTTGSLFVPVILSAAGRSNSFFTSELTLTNRGDGEVKLDYTYTAHRGGGSGKTSDVLAPGIQKIETDALTYLRGLGIAIPETGNRIGTLRVETRLGSEVEAVVRTTTVVPEGRAGLAYLGVAEEEGFDEAVYLCGLRQNSRDRSNLAFQNMGAEEEGAITLRTTVYSGEAADATARVLKDVRLEPGGFHQYSGLLGVLGVPAQGYVRVERVEGTSPFYAYGVINDQANSDGSFIFPVAARSLEGTAGQTLPVIVETSEFRSELTVTNFSEEARTLDFRFVADAIKTTDKTAGFSMTLEAGQQEIVPEVVDELRRQGVAGLGSTRGFYAGAVFVVAEEGDMSGIVIGARTGSEGGGGQYSVFYNAAPSGSAFTEEAWVDGLQQNRENRSNLALVNTGEVDGSPSVFHLEIYDGETGLLAETVVTRPVPARRWHQINGILGSYAPQTRQGYIRIEKVSGENPFLAYGVVNDGGAPGERSGDGAYVPARE